MPSHDQSDLEETNARKLFKMVKEMRRCGQRSVARYLFVLASKAMRYAIKYDRMAKDVIETWKYTLTGFDVLFLKKRKLNDLYERFYTAFQQRYRYDNFCDQFGL